MIIHINGFPGVGKLTTAQAYAQLTNAQMIDNHSLINITTMVHPHGSPEYLALLNKITLTVFEGLTHPKAPRDLIFTNALAAELQEDVDRVNMVRELATRRGDVFVPVLLTCNQKENELRLGKAGRSERQKLTNVDVLKDIYSKYTPYHPDDVSGLILDVSQSSAEETALFIKQHCDSLPSLSTSNQIHTPSHRP